MVISHILVVLDYDDVIKWKHFPRYWPFVRGIHRSLVNSPHKVQWCGALMFSLICAWINGWVNNRESGDLRRYRAHYDVTVMLKIKYVACLVPSYYLNWCSLICWLRNFSKIETIFFYIKIQLKISSANVGYFVQTTAMHVVSESIHTVAKIWIQYYGREGGIHPFGFWSFSLWRLDMGRLSPIPVPCEGIHRCYFDVYRKTLWNKLSSGRWFGTRWHSCDVTLMLFTKHGPDSRFKYCFMSSVAPFKSQHG